MASEPQAPPRQKSFAELFPWRNMRRAMMLILLIVAIVVVKRSAATWLSRVGDMWGPSAPAVSPAAPPAGWQLGERRVRLGPGLAPIPRSERPAVSR